MTGSDSDDRLPLSWGSLWGTIQPGSLIRSGYRATCSVITDKGDTVQISARDPHVIRHLEDLEENGTRELFRGGRLGGPGHAGPLLEVSRFGPEQLTGTVIEIRDGPGGEGPGLLFLIELEEEVKAPRIRVGIALFGEEAQAYEGVRVGERLRLEARDTEFGYVPVSPIRVIPSEDPEGPGL